MTAFKYFVKSERPRSLGSFVHAICPDRCRASVKGYCTTLRRREARGTKATEVNTRMTTVDHDRQGQAAHRHESSLQVSPCIIDTHDHKHEKFSL